MIGLLTLLFVIVEIPVLLIIAGVSKANEAHKKKAAREAFQGKSKEYLESARKMCQMGEYKLALASVRNSLEALVKFLCDKYGISYDYANVDLFSMIVALYTNGVIDDEQSTLMQQIRALSNKGSHVELNELPVTYDQASRVICKMEELLSSMYETHRKVVPGMFD